jgi:hypothetical protein
VPSDRSRRVAGPGRTALEIIRRVDGLAGVRLIQDFQLLETIARAADVAPEGERERRFRRAISPGDLERVLQQAHAGDRQAITRHLRGLTAREVLRIGLLIVCPECGHTNWCAPRDLDEDLTCELCLRQFPFPQTAPYPRWAYRARGGFRVQGFGDGSYSVALALHCLLAERHEPDTWTTNFLLEGVGEVDFAAMISERRWTGPSQPEFVFGECKSEGSFDDTDVERARAVRERFPHTFYAFASFKEELDQNEIDLLSAFARPDNPRPRFQPDTIVLTRTELFAREGLDEAWAVAGNRIASLAPNVRGWNRRGESWFALADLTQQMHLGLEPWSDWRDRQLPRIRTRARPQAQRRR